MSPTRLALVGAGRIGRLHARAIEASDRVELALVADPVERAAAALSGHHVRDVRELLMRGGFDGVLVAAPTTLHPEILDALIDAGVPVLCEKPCGLDSGEVRAAAAAADAAGVPVQVGYWRRFVPSLRELRLRIAGGELGEVATVICAQWDEAPPPAAFRAPATSGGVLVDMGVHEFDTLRWLTGQDLLGLAGFPSPIHYAEPIPGAADNVSLVARLSRGAGGVITLTRRHPPGDMCRVEVLAADAVEVVTYLEPPRSEEQLVEALRLQAEGFAGLVGGAARDGATLDDAGIALESAEAAAAALEAGEEALARRAERVHNRDVAPALEEHR